jgi:hypothetical protein
MKRPASDAVEQPEESQAGREALHRQLVQCSTGTALVQAFTVLDGHGGLNPTIKFKPRQLAKELTRAKQMHSNAPTPYGPVAQEMDLPSEKLPKWEYCNPLALLWYQASLSVPFFNLMQDTINLARDRTLNLIVYIDELCPGTPLRHDKGRTMHAIYYAFAEWPEWVLARTAAWPVFGVIRSTVVKQFPGFVSQLMKLILKAFFPEDRQSLHQGIVLGCSDGRTTYLKALFGGFLADEKGLKEIYDSKGQAGAFCVKPPAGI